MIKKLFGETEEEQFRYLKPRLIALGVGGVALLISLLLELMGVGLYEIFYILGAAVCVITLLMFGWAIMRGLFGIATLGVLFSRNVVVGVIIFVLYILLGYIGGLVVAVIGLCRFLVILKQLKQRK
ncbi:MAG: hypothetical protein MR419_12015 [Clostridiales bacterium]|nr:hypothetical protein [Clostridiales bacterium]MDY4171775.1 hypothetical protein [Evtepia sp.]